MDAHGQFCVRGGVVDFFPAGDEFPIRAEFAGDSLESLRRFDPATQRSSETLDQAEIFPLRELFEPAPGNGSPDADLDRSAWLRDYLRRVPGVRVYLSEGEASRTAIESRIEQAASSFADAETQGDPVLPPEQLLVEWPVLDDWLASVPRLEQLWEDEDEASGASHVACQPVVEMHGRIGDWAAEVARCRERGIRRCSSRGPPAGPSGSSSCLPTTTSPPAPSTTRTRPTAPRCWWRRASSPVDSGCRTPACRSSRKRTSSTRNAESGSVGPVPPSRSSPISAT